MIYQMNILTRSCPQTLWNIWSWQGGTPPQCPHCEDRDHHSREDQLWDQVFWVRRWWDVNCWWSHTRIPCRQNTAAHWLKITLFLTWIERNFNFFLRILVDLMISPLPYLYLRRKGTKKGELYRETCWILNCWKIR